MADSSSTDGFQYAYFRSEQQLRAGVKLWQVVSPFLIVFGTIGNVLSIIVMSRRRFKNWPSAVYLIAMAVADLGMLYIGLLRQWVKYTFDKEIRASSEVMCKIHWWLMYSTADMSVWILVAVTVERLLSAMCPYKSKSICTKPRARFVILGICFSSLFINSHLLYGFGELIIKDGNTTMVIPCAPQTDSYTEFFGKIWTWIDLCKYSLVPFGILSFGNVCIIWKLVQSSKKTKTQIVPAGGNTTSSTQGSQSSQTSNLSILLIGLNCMFIICTSPVCIYFIGEPYWIPKEVPRPIQLQDPWWALVNLLMYLNSTCNFILYCLSGSKFRDEIRRLFARFWKVKRRGGDIDTVTTAVATAGSF